jgi:LacI family transcriptional regulator
MTDESEQRGRGRATIVDVAQAAKVSVSTASLAIRGTGRLSQKTRDKVLAVAEALSYVPNKQAVGLRSGTSREIGLLIQNISNPFNAELTAGVASVIEKAGYLIYLMDAGEDLEKQQRLIQSIVHSGANGLIWHPARQTPEETVNFVRDAQIATVTALRPFAGEPFDYVGVNDFQSSQDAGRHLVKKGHKRIGFVGGEAGVIESSTQFAGYASALLEAGIAVHRENCEPCHNDKRSARDATLILLERCPDITAVMCYNDLVAFGAMYALSSLGKAVGREFAVIGCDDIEDAALSTPSLTTVAVSPYKIGIELASALLSRMANPHKEARSTVLRTALIVRDSTAFNVP